MQWSLLEKQQEQSKVREPSTLLVGVSKKADLCVNEKYRLFHTDRSTGKPNIWGAFTFSDDKNK